MWLKTGNRGRGVGLRAPETLRMDSFSGRRCELVISSCQQLSLSLINKLFCVADFFSRFGFFSFSHCYFFSIYLFSDLKFLAFP